MTPTKTQILGCGQNFPKQIVKSDDIFQMIKSESQYNIASNWMSGQMGIIERRFASEGVKPSDLAVPAAIQAMRNSNVNADDIDMVIFCGIESDQPEPATAHTIANKLGINAKRTFDVSNACFGFIDGMEIACNFINSKSIDCALIVTSEIFSKPVSSLLDKLKKGMDRKKALKAIGFLSLGDAGGAVVLGRSKNGVSGFDVFNTKTLSDEVNRCHYRVRKNGGFQGQMQMAHLSALMIKGHTQILDETLNKLGWDRFDWVLSHQIGQRPFERISQLNRVKPSKMIKTFDKFGNIASATFPVNFHKLAVNAKVKSGERIGGMFAGSGLVYGQIGYTM